MHFNGTEKHLFFLQDSYQKFREHVNLFFTNNDERRLERKSRIDYYKLESQDLYDFLTKNTK